MTVSFLAKVSKQHRVTIPTVVREILGIKEGDTVRVEIRVEKKEAEPQ